jgi:hypothetical protein
MAGRLTAAGEQHHPCKFSDSILAELDRILHDDPQPVERVIVDPFAGTGEKLDLILRRSEWAGIELEGEWASMNPNVRKGDALDPTAYPPRIGAIVTSTTYGNRFGDCYLGPPCPSCKAGRDVPAEGCKLCYGVGADPTGRSSYAVSLGRPPSRGSSAAMKWGPKFWLFHQRWLRLAAFVLDPGPRRLILNVSDFNVDRKRVYAPSWWIEAAEAAGFRLDYALPVVTPRLKMNHLRPGAAPMIPHELIMVFDLEVSPPRWVDLSGTWEHSASGPRVVHSSTPTSEVTQCSN